MTFDEAIEKLRQFGWEYFRIYVGIYPATVVENADPQDRGRIRITCPAVGQLQPFNDLWVEPSFMGAGANRGWYWPPEVGDSVYVVFEQGIANRPLCYFPGWPGAPNNATEVPSELGVDSNHNPKKRGFVTRTGHRFVFNEDSGNEAVELYWHKSASDSDRTVSTDRSQGDTSWLKFNSDGSIEINDKNNNNFKLDAANQQIVITDQNSHTITMSSGGVKIDCGSGNFEVDAQTIDLKGSTINLGGGASSPAPLGDQWLQWAVEHVHPSGVGPTGPATPPATPTLNSNNVKLIP